ncbi:MAG TPA: PH domain-containing protein [Propionibacteriaceae bacterium]|nr:PH domain-containing protein [Propionibacteriaceae bacterium]
MGLPPKLLGADEYEVIHTRTHAKALVGPALVLIVLGAAVGAGVALVPTEFRPIGQVAVAGLSVIPLLFWVVLPFLRWRTTTYTLTNRRLITRRGVLNKVSLDVPLDRIHEVSQERSLSDRMFGCGTLQIQTAAEDGVVVLADVPEVEHVHAEMTGLLFGRTP